MSAFNTLTTLRPGYLVGLKTAIKGNVKHKRENEQEHVLPDGQSITTWDSERTILDKAEQEAAVETRGKARRLIEAVCTKSDFGLLCAQIDEPELDKALIAAEALCVEFNKTAKVTRIRFASVRGTIAPDDLKAARALRKEVAELIEDMKGGLEQLDVETVRAAASRVKQLGAMLTPDAAAKVQIAVEQARSLARRIVAAGDQGAAEIDRATIARLTEARTAFLDVDMPAGEIAAPFVEGRAVDFEPEGEKKVTAAASGTARQIEL